MKKRFLKLDEDNRIAFLYEDNGGSDNDPKKPLILMVHDFPDGQGMNGHNGLYQDFAKQLAADGFDTMRFDFRGCGESSGEEKDFCIETAIHDLQAILHWGAVKHGHDRVAIIASGLGCAVTALAYNPDLVNEVVFLWPVLRPMKTPLSQLESKQCLDFMTDHDFCLLDGHQIGKHLSNELRQMDLVDMLQKIRAVTQLQQGTGDDYSSYAHVEEMRRYLTGLQDYCVFEKGGHHLDDPAMREQAIRNAMLFLKKYQHRRADSFYTYLEEELIIRNIS